MLILNLIITLAVLACLIINLRSMSESLRVKNYFMQYHLEENDFIYKTAITYKKQLLKINRIYFLFAALFALIIIPLNKSYLVLFFYFSIFFIGPYLVNQFFIDKYSSILKELNALDYTQDENFSKWGLLYNDSPDSKVFKTYSVRRFALNINNKLAKPFLAGAASILALLLAFSIMHDFKVGVYADKIDGNPEQSMQATHPINKDLKYDYSKDKVIMTYKDKKTVIETEEITKVSKINEFPQIIANVSGFQESGINIGVFNVQGISKANLFVDRDHQPFIQITTKDKKVYLINFTEQDFFDKLKNNTKK